MITQNSYYFLVLLDFVFSLYVARLVFTFAVACLFVYVLVKKMELKIRERLSVRDE